MTDRPRSSDCTKSPSTACSSPRGSLENSSRMATIVDSVPPVRFLNYRAYYGRLRGHVHMPVALRTQVGIVGAGPAGLLLSHLLALAGIDSLVVEDRSRAYCEARQRAGLLEDGTVRLLREADLAERLDGEGMEHGGSDLQLGGA